MKRSVLAVILSLWGLWGVGGPAFAEFTLAVTPAVSRNDIGFGQVEEGAVVTQEAEVKITNDTGVRYRITHTLLEPLKNEQDDALAVDRIRFFLRSASRGTMQIQTPTTLQIGSVEIYTSDQSGTQDTMTLAYTLFVPEKIKGGSYRGRVTINLEPLTGSSDASLKSVTLDISFEARSIFQLVFTSESGTSRLDFGKATLESPEKASQMFFETLSNLGAEYRIYQSLSEPLIHTDTGKPIPNDKLAVIFSSQTQGTLSASVSISADPVLVYRSDLLGSSDRFVGVYVVKNMDLLSAGRYQGSLLFTVETAAALPASVPTSFLVPVSLEVESVFDFVLTPSDGNILEFRDLKPGQVVEDELVIEIRSNARQPYQIQQVITEPFSTDTGEVIPEENFQVQILDAVKGQAPARDFQPVKMGNMVLYTSNKEGEPDKIRLLYRLTVPKEARGGTYRMYLSFSLLLV